MALPNLPGNPEGLSEAVHWVQARFKELQVCWLIYSCQYEGGFLHQVECSVVKQTSSCVELRCSATKNMWLNQRRKRRLLQQLESLEQQSNTGLYIANGFIFLCACCAWLYACVLPVCMFACVCAYMRMHWDMCPMCVCICVSVHVHYFTLHLKTFISSTDSTKL